MVRCAHIVALIVLASSLFLFPSISAQTGDGVLIEAFYPDTKVSYEPDEFIRIVNSGASAVDIGGWEVGDDAALVTIPPGTTLDAGSSCVFAGNGTAYFEEQGVWPDFEYDANSSSEVETIPVTSGSGIRLSNAGDVVRLYDSGGSLVDVAAYGDSTWDQAGWQGSSIPTRSEGQEYWRNGGDRYDSFIDTDSAADFDGLRFHRPGQSHFPLTTFSVEQIHPYVSPDGTFAMLEGRIDAATNTADIGLYQFTNYHLWEVLDRALDRGVSVRLLLEGVPVGFGGDSLSQQEWIVSELVNAGAEVRFFTSNAEVDHHARYTYLHAKYMIVDSYWTLAQSENWVDTGSPADPSFGNRGWGVAVGDPELAEHMTSYFEDDWDLAHDDVIPYDAADDRNGAPPASFAPDSTIETGNYEPRFFSGPLGPAAVTAVVSPDTSLAQGGILALLNNAQDELLIQQLSFSAHWGASHEVLDEAEPSPLIEATLEAGRRGVKIRILLEGAFVNDWDSRSNQASADLFNSIATEEGLDIEAKIMDMRGTGMEKIHNKGALADGDLVLVSSINWVENSMRNNREVGLIIDSTEAGDFYRAVFWDDWGEPLPETDVLQTPLPPLLVLVFVPLLLVLIVRSRSSRSPHPVSGAKRL